MKTITENKIKNIKEFRRAPEHDFKDDGSSFTGWEYKGLPLSQCRNSGSTYLSFRVDYLNEETSLPAYFTYDEYRNLPWYEICDKYNGVDELPEMEEIVEDLEIVIAGIQELNKKVKDEKIDVEPILIRLEKENEIAENAVEKYSKINLFDDCYTNYDIECIRKYMKNLKGYLKTIESIKDKLPTLGRRDLKQCLKRCQSQYGIVLNENNFYIQKLEEFFNMAK